MAEKNYIAKEKTMSEIKNKLVSINMNTSLESIEQMLKSGDSTIFYENFDIIGETFYGKTVTITGNGIIVLGCSNNSKAPRFLSVIIDGHELVSESQDYLSLPKNAGQIWFNFNSSVSLEVLSNKDYSGSYTAYLFKK